MDSFETNMDLMDAVKAREESLKTKQLEIGQEIKVSRT